MTEFPAGVTPPDRAHIYRRRDHFLVQWWDPTARKNVSQRVNGDLVDALGTAREIDRNLKNFRNAGRGNRNLRHQELVQAFLADLKRQADAGDIVPATVSRYRTALNHYAAFAEQLDVLKAYPVVVRVDRQFALDLAAFLNNRKISPNGHPNAKPRKMHGQTFVLDTVRAMYEWASDPLRGNCMPSGFQSPFRRATLKRRKPVTDQAGEPDITLAMAAQLLEACDAYQLPLFATMLLCGLRAGEPVFLFREHIQRGWLTLACLPDFGFTTKGGRDKRVPMLDELARLLTIDRPGPHHGLLFLRRRVAEGIEAPPLLGQGVADLIVELERRCEQAGAKAAADKHRLRDQVVRDAGGLDYDRIDGEFRRVADKLRWPARATLKDLRHLFATCLANGGMPEHERRYLLGHAPGRAAINIYTHLTGLEQRYREVADSQCQPILKVLGQRMPAV